jgi:hypothetical protein
MNSRVLSITILIIKLYQLASGISDKNMYNDKPMGQIQLLDQKILGRMGKLWNSI